MPTYCFICEKCNKTESLWKWVMEKPEAPECCSVPMDRDYRTEHFGHKPASGFPYVTKNITGEPIEIKSIEHERQVCKRYGVRKRDDAGYIDEHMGEGSGRGLPGSWA